MKKIYFSTIFVLFCLASGQVKAITYNLKAGGTITNPADWGTNAAGTTGAPANFTGVNNIWNLATNNSVLTLSSTWSVNITSTINFGTGSSNFIFTLANTGLIGVPGAAPKIVVANQCTMNINGSDNFNSSAIRTIFNAGSVVIYGAGATNVSFIQGAFYDLIINSNVLTSVSIQVANDLVINAASNLSGGSLNVTRDLVLNAGLDMGFGSINVGRNTTLNADITLSGGSVSMAGTLSGTGSFSGTNSDGSSLSFTGSGSIGTIKFLPGGRFLSSLAISGSGTVTLGNDLVMDAGILSLTSGALNLNGHTLAVENTSAGTNADFTGTTIMGSSASALYIDAQNVTGTLLMDASANTLKSLYLNANGQTLTLGNSLNITDSISAFDGTIASGNNLTLKATSTLKGRVGTKGPTGNISGNVTVEIFADGPSTGWAQLGSGGVQNQTINDWQNQFPMTCNGCNYDVNSAGGFYSIQGWDATSSDGFDTTAVSINVNTPLTPGKGFWVYLGTGGTITSPITITNTGPLVQGNLSYNLRNSFQSSDMAANPYASPISWDKLHDLNDGSNFDLHQIDIWNTDGGGRYETHMYGDNFSIPAGQAFFVYPFSDNYPLIFDESVKTADNTGANPLIRAQARVSNVSGFTLTVAGSNGDLDKTEFRFNNNASTSFDRGFDGYKRFASPGYVGYPGAYDHYTTISSRLQNTDYYRNTLPVLTQSLTVPILVKVSATGVYTIAASAFKNFNSCAMLKDNLTGIYHNLANGDYVCTINDTTSTPRFELFLCEQNVASSVAELNNISSNIGISQDQEGPFVTTHFAQNTKATISVYNVVGQQLIKDLVVEGTDTTTRLNVEAHNQVLLIRVSTAKETITKKIIAH